ncbi:MAG: glycosyltransferase [Cyanobacteria bacterium J06631_2]
MSAESPLVSIVISAYEGLNYLPATVDSILQQSCDDFEIIVFSDDCRQLHSWFKRQPDCRLRFILQSNLGLATTLNEGILEARGKYIAFINPGDLWHPSKLQKQVSLLDRNSHVGLVHSESMLIDYLGHSTGKIIRSGCSNAVANTLVPDVLQRSEILAQNQFVFSSVMVRRDCFEKVGLFDPQLKIIPDWEMWIRLGDRHFSMTIAEPLVYCRQHQLSNQDNWLTLELDLQKIIEQVYALIPLEQEAREKQKQLSYSYASLFLAQEMLQHKTPDPLIARNYLYQALQHQPLICLSLEFCYLRWDVFALSCRQSDRYRDLVKLAQTLAAQIKAIAAKTRAQAQIMLNWMLEEEESINFWKSRKVKQQGKIKN